MELICYELGRFNASYIIFVPNGKVKAINAALHIPNAVARNRT